MKRMVMRKLSGAGNTSVAGMVEAVVMAFCEGETVVVGARNRNPANNGDVPDVGKRRNIVKRGRTDLQAKRGGSF